MRAFVLRQDLCDCLADAQLFTNCLRRHAVVAGQHHHVNALLPQRTDCLRTGWLYRIHDRNHAQNSCLICKIQWGTPVFCQLLRGALPAAERQSTFLHQRTIACKIFFPLQICRCAAPKDCLKVRDLLRRNLPFFRAAEDRLCQRMLTAGFQPSRHG